MLQAINLQFPRASLPTRQRHNSTHHHKAQLARKYVNLHFKQDDHTFKNHRGKKVSSPQEKQEMFYRTFHPRDRSKKHRSHHYYSRKTGRETAISQRDTVVGTPFASLDAIEQDIPAPVFPSLDRQRYKYLLNAVSGGTKIKRLPDFRTQNKSLSIQHTQKIASQSPNNKDIGSPNIINLSVNFEENRKSPQLQSENSYQKMFKNKQLLLKGRYNSIKDTKEPLINFLMDDDLKVRQATFENRRNKRKIIN